MKKDFRTGNLAKELKRIGLVDLILNHHHYESFSDKFAGNRSGKPIYAIFGTSLLDIFRARFFTFDTELTAAPSDGHRMLRIEVSNLSLLNEKVPHNNESMNLNKLCCKDPWIRKRYIK